VEVDRKAALKNAEKFLRQGKLDAAIKEYVRLVEDQPKDWNSLNALGDLYIRAKDPNRAIEQYGRVADHLFEEGFLPKAAALYKKVLKVKSEHEPAIDRLGEIAGRQGKLTDAKMYLLQLSDLRRRRGDERGAAEPVIRLGSFEEADVELRVAGAKAAQQIGDAGQAVVLLKQAARELDKQNHHAQALELRVEAAQLDPSDLVLRADVARECVRSGDLSRASLVLTAEAAGDDPDLLAVLARIDLDAGRDEQARTAFTRLVTIAPDRQDEVMRAALELARASRLESAIGCVEVVADAALIDGEWHKAIAALQSFVREVPHLPSLLKLVELCVDADAEEALREAQALLADAYLAAGQAAEARVIAEDLFDHEPGSEAHAARLRAALEQSGVADPDQVIKDKLRPQAPIDAIAESSDEPSAKQPVAAGPVEVDLSDALSDLRIAPVVTLPPAQPTVADAGPTEPPRDLEAVFEGIRARVSQSSDASAHYDSGIAHLGEGRIEKAISELEAAARVPVMRFKAASALGRLCIERGDVRTGVAWLERAAEVPAPTTDEGFAVLYDLAGALERQGELARALGVLMELGADAGDYRDIRSRIESLSRVQAGSHGA
jgi:tetratricopeptide (TPR) repeat protein